MILIVSVEFDPSTYEVAGWIKYLSQEAVVILNENNSVNEFIISINNKGGVKIKLISLYGDSIDIDEIISIWLRKGSIIYNESSNRSNIDQVERILKMDISNINDFIYSVLISKRLIGDPNNTEINKFKVLAEATNVGLMIPYTLITNRKNYIQEYFKEKKVIAKSINSILFETKKNVYQGFTKCLDYTDIPEAFGPSLTQEMIIKKYELRIFFLNEDYYASAIFSQSNEKTKVDFRDYDNKNPNRLVPYILPNIIETKLKLLMKTLGLNTGSIDMIVNHKDEYIFLEVNPSGQYGMISKPCNYYIEREIAKVLIEKTV